ncbi:MAG: prolipoprotein diacylglyceryl transferase family protein [Planctomycetota bacterium]
MGDVIIPCLFIGIALGRLGCLMNGCCFGGRCDAAR